ncbi:hypothetical protein TNCV_3937451 [Trichonephila clavipes]|nr:hypothetical protein TNCV_3937451 [Trichonephila clavipes]
MLQRYFNPLSVLPVERTGYRKLAATGFPVRYGTFRSLCRGSSRAGPCLVVQQPMKAYCTHPSIRDHRR